MIKAKLIGKVEQSVICRWEKGERRRLARKREADLDKLFHRPLQCALNKALDRE